MNRRWLDRNLDLVLEYLREQVQITFAALALGVLLAVPLGLLAHRWQRAYPTILALLQILYTIPSIALFVLLIVEWHLRKVFTKLGIASRKQLRLALPAATKTAVSA